MKIKKQGGGGGGFLVSATWGEWPNVKTAAAFLQYFFGD
jgi:hypothetical protein